MNIIVIGFGTSASSHQIMAELAAIVMVPTGPPPTAEPPGRMEMAISADMFTNAAHLFQAEEPPKSRAEIRAEVWRGIVDCQDWLRARVSGRKLRVQSPGRPRARVIFQPCWSRRRWRSVT